jgi:hypothetical protein
MLTAVCPHCAKKVGVPDNAAGRNLQCPYCRGAFKAGGGQPQTMAGGDRVKLSAVHILWPQMCAGCCGEVDGVHRVAHFRKGDKGKAKAWKVPYCRRCLDLVEAGAPPAVVYEGWKGTVHAFLFFTPDYAASFKHANQSKLLNETLAAGQH